MSSEVKWISSPYRRLGDIPSDRASLAGVNGVLIVVEPLPDELSAAGLRVEDLETLVAQHLCDAGLAVRTSIDEGNRSSIVAVGLLVSGVCVTAQPPGLYAFDVTLHVRQVARLERDPSIRVFSISWASGITGAALGSQFLEVCRQAVISRIDHFVEAWKQCNSA